MERGINIPEDSMLQKRGYELLKVSGTIVHSGHRRARGTHRVSPLETQRAAFVKAPSEASVTCPRKRRRYSRKSGRDNTRETPGVSLSQGLSAVIKVLNINCNRMPFGELCRIMQSRLSLQSQCCVALFGIHCRREGSKDSSPDRNPAWHRRLCSVDNSDNTLKRGENGSADDHSRNREVEQACLRTASCLQPCQVWQISQEELRDRYKIGMTGTD